MARWRLSIAADDGAPAAADAARDLVAAWTGAGPVERDGRFEVETGADPWRALLELRDLCDRAGLRASGEAE